MLGMIAFLLNGQFVDFGDAESTYALQILNFLLKRGNHRVELRLILNGHRIFILKFEDFRNDMNGLPPLEGFLNLLHFKRLYGIHLIDVISYICH
jgi:hypothetical protein